jgi:hypothetical protein
MTPEQAVRKRAKDRAYYARTKAARREYYVRTRDRFRSKRKSYRLKYRYGITTKEARLLAKAQGGNCPLCGKRLPPSGRRLHIDHSPQTGLVRGILHAGCNTALGFYEACVMPRQEAYDAYIERGGLRAAQSVR